MTSAPRIYLAAPAALSPEDTARAVSDVLGAADIACLRLPTAGRGAETIAALVTALRPVAAAADLPLVIDDHFRLAAELGVDGVHLTDGARHVRAARKALGKAAIVGAFAHASRHEGMAAGEAGADYVSFGPVGDDGLGDGQVAEPDLFAWWAQLIELPVVAEGAVSREAAPALAGVADFIALGEELWRTPDPRATLAAYAALLSGR